MWDRIEKEKKTRTIKGWAVNAMTTVGRNKMTFYFFIFASLKHIEKK
jgi:hypothetical protein